MGADAGQDLPEFSLDAFLRENYPLFAIMSVFGAVSLYLTSMAAEISERTVLLFVNIGIVSSLLLFALVSYVINQRFVAAYLDLEFLFFYPSVWPKFVGVVFIVFFDLLTLCVASIVLYYSEGLAVVLGLLAFLFAIVATYKIMYYASVYTMIGLRRRGWEISLNTSEAIYFILYFVIVTAVFGYLRGVRGYTFDISTYLQYYPLSLIALITLGSLVGAFIATIQIDEDRIEVDLRT